MSAGVNRGERRGDMCSDCFFFVPFPGPVVVSFPAGIFPTRAVWDLLFGVLGFFVFCEPVIESASSRADVVGALDAAAFRCARVRHA